MTDDGMDQQNTKQRRFYNGTLDHEEAPPHAIIEQYAVVGWRILNFARR